MSNKVLVITKPALGRYSADCLRLEERKPVPLEPGEVRLRTIYLSLDPTNRNWLKLGNATTVVDKVDVTLKVGDVMLGQMLGVIEESRADGYNPGDLVGALARWETHPVIKAKLVRRITPAPNEPFSTYLSLFSHIGRAALIGMKHVLDVRAGETVLVSGAAGATGSVAVGIAKARGCRVVGIAGGAAKCALVTNEFGADAAIDYKNEDVGEALGRICPEGVDAFFDNVGGQTLDAALLHMNNCGRIAVCGVMSDYDNATPEAGYGVRNLFRVLIRRLRIEGFLADQVEEEPLIEELRELFRAGAIKHRPHIVQGFQDAPEHLGLLMRGQNEGKLMVQVSPEV